MGDAEIRKLTVWLFVGVFFLVSSPSLGRMKAGMDTSSFFPEAYKLEGDILPNLQQCTHKTGRLWFTVSNYGILGNQRNVFLRDCLTGGPASSAEFPGGTGVEYLFQGAVWIGGIVGIDKDTLVSVGGDGWVNIREFFPEAGAKGNIIHRSTNPISPYYSPDAISDQDIIAVFYDTLKDPRLVTSVDPETGEPFKPLGIKVEQRSYSWGANWGQDWVLLDYTLTNNSPEPIKQAYFGIFLDSDIGDHTSGLTTQLDDYCGFLPDVFLKYADGYFETGPAFTACRETLNLAFAYDNDGDPGEDGSSGVKFPTGVLGVRFLRAGENPSFVYSFPSKIAFNWWVPDSRGILDWGPQKFPGRQNIFLGRGQPTGDRMRYYYLSNKEVDYDQIYSALDYGVIDPFVAGQWRPPLTLESSATDIADGADSRFLLSVGPFDLAPGDNLPVTLAVVAGVGFHADPANYADNFPSSSDFLDPVKISAYKSRLNLNGLIESARMARKVYDNENIFSPFTCQFTPEGPVQDSGRWHGDGLPDFKGPSPPTFPKVEYATDEGEVTVRWFGKETETSVDPISGLKDFEGYMVQMSTDGVGYTVVAYVDKVNWRVHYLNRDFNGNGYTDYDNPFTERDDTADVRWAPLRNRPLTYDEIQNYYAIRWDTCLNKPGNIQRPIDPTKFNSLIRVWGRNRPSLPYVPTGNAWCNPDTTKSTIRVRFCNSCGRPAIPRDTILYFQPEGPNTGLDKLQMYPNVTDPANDSAYWYEFKMTGLFPSQPVWFAVVPFDNGMFTYYQKIDPQSPSPNSVAQLLYPIATDSTRKADSLKISVYPNPYRIDHDYSFFEKKQPITGHPQSSKRVNFINLPAKCTIRIYTLDGDLVQQINHDKDPSASDAGYEFWDLLTRNAQFVVAGLYLFTVESAEGRYVGKLVIIQ